MGEFAAKFRPEVDLDEFERRLRAAAPAPHSRPAEGSDPLAELARLVGGDSMGRKEDPFEALFRAQSAIADMRNASAQQEQAADAASAAEAKPGAFDHYALREPYFEEQAQQEQGQAHQAYPREAYPQQASPNAAYAAEQLPYQESEPVWTPGAHSGGDAQSWPAAYDNGPEAPAPGYRRKVMYAMGAVLALGVFAIGGTLAMRGKASNQDVVTIQADSDPAKVKPTAADNAATPAGQALFDRKSNGNVSKVAGGSEQPADLGVTVKNARVVGAAAGVETPPPPAPTNAAQNGPPPEAIFPTPKKVKTVSVRADGTVISSQDAPVPPSRNLPTMAANAMPPTASAAAPATKTPAPKTTERAASTNEAALKNPAHPQVAAVKPQAEKPAAAPAAGEGGGFAVQLAGTPSEAEAKAAANSLAAKYASALQGHRPSFVQAKVGDKTIYRVRVGHLSEEGAKSMCSAIKAQGGNCFVAKN